MQDFIKLPVKMPFEARVDDENYYTRDNLAVLQVNVGRLCNLSCKHCHVNAGPNRTEVMEKSTMNAILDVAKNWHFKTIDITGGAPEMNPNFRWFVKEACALCDHVIVRSNLVIMNDPNYRDLPALLAKHNVEIDASLPYYRAHETDKVRGQGTFDEAIKVIQLLNSFGYGRDESHILNLVYNPAGAFFTPDQAEMEDEYRRRLKNDFGIDFSHLFCILNNPTGRFEKFLEKSGNLDEYMSKLESAFNPATLPNMMCRNQLSVAWDGQLFDCDFNQAANLPITTRKTIFDIIDKPYVKRKIAFGNHCYACCAGQGSSCGGATN